MKHMTASAASVCAIMLACASLTGAAPTVDPVPATSVASASETHANYHGAFDLGAATDDPAVGGLSGLTSLDDGSYLAISDDKGDHGPTRAYHLNIDQSGAAKVAGEVDFTNPDGSAYDPSEFDAEEIRQLPDGNLLWTTEGDATSLTNRTPMLIESDPQGREIRRIQPPEYHVPNVFNTRGINANKGPEAMTISAQGDAIFTINENTLVQDGQLNTPEAGSKTRMTVYDAATGLPAAEYVVDVDPVYAKDADRGYASMATAPNGDLLALQRGYIPDQGNRGEVYRLDFSKATNVLGKERLDGSEVAVSREKVFDFATDAPAGQSPENVEGMAFAEPSASEAAGLAPAERLHVISDNNFSDSQRTLVHTIDLQP